MTAGNKIYFASDFHLGLKAGMDPLLREKHVVSWLKMAATDAKAIYLVGDIFDFWWEYKSVVPKGFTRFLGTASELTDSGIEIHFFTGNHDMWIDNYLSDECGMILHTKPLLTEQMGKKFYIAHGEGLGIKDRSYKLLLMVFRNKFLRRLYSALHPRIGLAIAHNWSRHSRLAKNYSEEFMGAENESLIRHAYDLLGKNEIDFFIFGHRHIALDYLLNNKKSRVFIMGNWFNAPCYVRWDGIKAELKEFSYR